MQRDHSGAACRISVSHARERKCRPEILDACFALRQIAVRPLWESSSTQAIVRGVAEGLGVAVLPCLLVKKNIEEHAVKMIPFTLPLTRKLNIIYHKSKYLTNNMNAFINLCKEYGSGE